MFLDKLKISFLIFCSLITFSEILASEDFQPVITLEKTNFLRGEIIPINGFLEPNITDEIIQLQISLRNPQRDIIFTEIILNKADGSFSTNIEIPKNSTLGIYTIDVTNLCDTENPSCENNNSRVDIKIIKEENQIENLNQKEKINFEIVNENVSSENENVITFSTNDLILGFSIAVAVIAGILIYLTKDSLFRKKGDYEKKNYQSKINRDYEKYHSNWTDDSEDLFGKNRKKTNQEFKEFLSSKKIPNYYQILELPNFASSKEIKEKYRELVKTWHPDKTKNKDSEIKISKINEAYEILSDPEKKKAFDLKLKEK